MQRFFFHVHDGVNIRDEEGTECANWQVAQQEAIRLAGAIISDSAMQIQLGENWAMEVTTENNLLLFHLEFHITGAPAVTMFRRLSESAYQEKTDDQTPPTN